MADVDASKALADGYTQAQIDEENARRRAARPNVPTSPVLERPDTGETLGQKWLGAAKDVAEMPFDAYHGIKRSLESTGRGLRQAGAAIAPGLIDPEAARLAQEKAEQEEEKNPSSMTSDIWKGVADVAPWMVGGATMIPKAINAFPRVASAVTKMIPSQFLRSSAGAAIGGAAQAPLNPTSGEYDLGDKMLTGAAFGPLFSLAGYGMGRAYAPFRNAGAGERAKESAVILNNAGMPKQIPATQTDDATVQAMTNALEQVPGFSHWVKRARKENAGWLTSKATEGTGKAVSDLTQGEMETMYNRLNAEGNAFRTSKKIDMTSVADAADQAQKDVHEYAANTAKLAKEKPLTAAATQLAPMPGNPATAQRAATGMPYPHLPPIATKRTSAEVMDLRNAASELAFKETDPKLKLAYQTYKKSLEDKLRAAHGSDRFDTWLKQWGEMERVTRAAGGKSGDFLKGGKLTPERLAMNLDDSFRPGSEMDKLVAAARTNMPTPPPGTNRALITSMLLGGTLGSGAITKAAGGDFKAGVAPPLTLGAILASGLSRKVPTQAQIDMVRRMTMAGLIAKNPFTD